MHGSNEVMFESALGPEIIELNSESGKMMNGHRGIYHLYSGPNKYSIHFFKSLEPYEWTGIGLEVEERISEVKRSFPE